MTTSSVRAKGKEAVLREPLQCFRVSLHLLSTVPGRIVIPTVQMRKLRLRSLRAFCGKANEATGGMTSPMSLS